MRKVWLLGVGVLVVGLLVASGCQSAPRPYVSGYSEAKDLMAAGDCQAAIEQFQAYINESPESKLVPYAWFHIAECYVKMGDKAKAIETYNAVISKYPDSEPAEWAKKDLEMLEKHPEVMMPASGETTM